METRLHPTNAGTERTERRSSLSTRRARAALPTPMAAILALLGAFASAGCGNAVQFSDDVDLTIDLSLFTPFSEPDDMHVPYEQGSSVVVYVRDQRGEGDLAGCTLESTDPEVFSIAFQQYEGEVDEIQVDGFSAGPGDADLVLYDSDGEEIDRTSVEVAFPNRIDLHAAGPMLVENADVESYTGTPRVVAGGTATFQVRYFEGDRQLYGNGALTVSAVENVGAETDRTYLFENREWVRVTPLDVGVQSVDLLVDGIAAETVDIDVVDDDAIADVAVYGSGESGAEEDEWLVVLAHATDAQGGPVYGVAFGWEVDGLTQTGDGDLYRYAYDPDREVEVTAVYGDLSATDLFHAGEGYVDSSNELGCDHASGPLSGAAALLAGLLAFGRRFRRHG